MTPASEPNVIWAGEQDPPTHYMDGREPVLLPTAAVCRAGFWSAEPARLVRLSGGGFKLQVRKGREADKVKVSLGRIKRRGAK